MYLLSIIVIEWLYYVWGIVVLKGFIVCERDDLIDIDW